MSFNNSDISLKKLVLRKLSTPSMLAICFIVIFTMMTFKYWIWWNDFHHPFHNDVDQYYSYLVGLFIHHDLSFDFSHHFWLIKTPIGEVVPKVTMGIAILNLPFFIIGDNIAYVFDYAGDGYSAPYAWSIHFGAMFYAIVGFWYVRKTLLLFFSEWITAISILCILFATNLFYYTYREPEMSHSYLFFLSSVFLHNVIKWHNNQKIKHLYYLSFTAGFISLIRPTECLVLLFPLLYNVVSFKTLKENFLLFIKLKWKLLVAFLFFLLPIIPQMLYWKYYTGKFLFFSYGSQEGFFFTDPRFYSVLFGWHKGWFVYTPMMFLVMVGLFLMFRKWKTLFFATVVYLALNIYLISCWWDWGFGGAYGMRALVQSYAFLVFPLAYFFHYIFNVLTKKIIKVLAISLTCCFTFIFIGLNIYHIKLFKSYCFHWDSNSKALYMYTLFESNLDPKKCDSLFIHPDYTEMLKGNREEKE